MLIKICNSETHTCSLLGAGVPGRAAAPDGNQGNFGAAEVSMGR